MNNDEGKIWFGLGLDNEQLRADAQRSIQLFKGVSNQVAAEGHRIELSIKKAATAWLGFVSMREASHFALSIAQVRGEFQQLEVAFKTMLGSKAKADALMAQIVETAAKTPFDLQGVANGAKQLLAYGVASERVNDTLIRLGNISAGLSIPLGDLVYLYGTTMTQGRLFTQDLRQFMGRGIPLADELAKQFGVTKDQVGELVTAGRVGFPEVQRAIESMTSEGGKFYNLMEEQSKTITGQISNLEDAWATMLNNIGKSSEGAITTALNGVAYLIENYESVLKVISLLITAYGSYKAAIIVTATAQKVMASIDSVQAWLDRTKMLTRATQAQILFNKAVSANPYVIVALAITGLVAGIYALVTAETAGERAQRKYNDSLDDFNQKLEEKRARIEQLIAIIQDETQTHFTQVQAYDELGRLVPALTEAYTMQELKTLDLANAQKLLNTERDEAKYRNLINNVNKYSQELQHLNDRFNEATNSESQIAYGIRIEETEKLLKHAKSDLAEYERLKKIAEEQAKPVEVRLLEAKTDLNQIQKEFDAAKKKLEEEQAKIAAGKSIFIPIEVSIMYDFQRGRLSSAQENFSNLQNEAQTKVKNYGVEYLTARKEWETAKRELRKIEQDKSAFTKEQYDNAKKREKDAKDAFALLGGNTSENNENNALKKQQSLSYALVQADLDLQQQRIAVLRDGRNKRLAEIDLEYRQTAAKINKEKGEAQKNGATKDQLSVYDDQITVAEQKRLRDRQQIEREYAQETAETYLRLSDVFVSEEERKTRAVERTYQAMRDKAVEDFQAGNISAADFVTLNIQIDDAEAYEQMQDLVDAFGTTQDKITKIQQNAQQAREKAIKNNRQDLLPQIDRQEQEEISKIELDELMKSDDWLNLFQNLDVLSQKKIHEIIDRINEQLKNAKLSPIDFKTVVDQLDRAENTARSKNPFTALARGIPKLKSALKVAKKAWEDYEKAKDTPEEAAKRVAAEQAQINADKTRLETWQDAQKSAADLSQTIGAVGDMLGKFGVEMPQEIEGVMGAMDAFASMDLTRPFSIVTGAIQGVASLIGGLFGAKDHLIPQKVFDQYDAFIDVLDKVIDREKELIETATGAQAVIASDEALKAIERQEDATRRLAKAYLASREKGKKSYGVRIERELRGYKDEIETAGFDWKKLYGTGRMEGLFDMSAEQIKDFQKSLPEVWAHLDEKTREYLETIIECGEKAEEIQADFKDAATGISFDSLRGELMDFLNDMDSTFDDVAGNFEDTMMNAINRVISSGLDEDLKKWYDDFSKRMEDDHLSDTDREALRREYERIYNEALQKRNAAYEAAGIDPKEQDNREASKKGIATASQDSVDENNGRLTVIQGHTYNIWENMKLMLPPLTETAINTSEIRAGMDALKANSGLILEHLAGIRDNTEYCRRLEPIEADLRGVKNMLDSINTKGIMIKR